MTSRFMHFCDIRKNIPVLSRELFPSINKIFGTTYSIVFALLRHGYHVLLVIFSRVFGLLHDNEVSLRAISVNSLRSSSNQVIFFSLVEIGMQRIFLFQDFGNIWLCISERENMCLIIIRNIWYDKILYEMNTILLRQSVPGFI